MPTPETLRRLADEADEQAAELAQQAATLRQQAAELRRLADLTERSGLPRMHRKGTLGEPKMEAETASPGAKLSRTKTRGQWPFQVALHKRNVSPPEWARAQKKPAIAATVDRSVEVARCWLKRPSHGGRPIPLEWAERIAAEFVDEHGESEVPAVDGSWPNGISRPHP